jgi:hypothetical protein
VFDSLHAHQFTEKWQSPVYCICLENRSGLKLTVGSNPTFSANYSRIVQWQNTSLIMKGSSVRVRLLLILTRSRKPPLRWSSETPLVGHRGFDSYPIQQIFMFTRRAFLKLLGLGASAMNGTLPA